MNSERPRLVWLWLWLLRNLVKPSGLGGLGVSEGDYTNEMTNDTNYINRDWRGRFRGSYHGRSTFNTMRTATIKNAHVTMAFGRRI
jgi:hypothetical protein